MLAKTTDREELLDHIFQQILIISKGECQIDDQMLSQIEHEGHLNVLLGLQMLHEDLNLYKEELKAKMEAEFQLEVLKKRNEELAQFNYVASHDLQEPLRTIQSFIRLLSRNTQDTLSKENKRFLKYIEDSANRMTELIFGLLNYSQLGNTLMTKPIDCNQLMQEVLLDLKFTIQQSNPIIKIDKLPHLIGDKVLLRQVFQNLTSNALKFKKPTERIQLEVKAEEKKKEYHFHFKDNGIGMEQQYLDRIFKIFQRLHSKKEFDGTGIGLATCKKIIEMHNGKIWVESAEGIGTTFFVALPKNQSPNTNISSLQT